MSPLIVTLAVIGCLTLGGLLSVLAASLYFSLSAALRTRKLRRDPQIGDGLFFINSFGLVPGTITKVNYPNVTVRRAIVSRQGGDLTVNINECHALTKTELEYILTDSEVLILCDRR